MPISPARPVGLSRADRRYVPFLQGATGNINPLLMGWDWTHLARLGLPLGAEAVRIYWSMAHGAEPANGGVGVASSQLQLPPLLPSSIEEGRETISTLEMERERLSAGGNEGALWWAELRLDRARKGLAALQGGARFRPLRPK